VYADFQVIFSFKTFKKTANIQIFNAFFERIWAETMDEKMRAGVSERTPTSAMNEGNDSYTAIFCFISIRAFVSWSGQDVPLDPQFMPLSFSMTVSTGIPSTNLQIPCKFPLHPDMNDTCVSIPSSMDISISFEHVPFVL